MKPARLFNALLVLCTITLSWPAEALEKVSLQLKWKHQFQFAGYYAAKELGYYRDAGLEVEIIPAAPGINAIDAVLRGDAEYGVGNSGLLLRRSNGEPVVVLAVIMQHSPFILIARQEMTLNGIQGVAGRRVMLEPMSDEIVAFLNHNGLPPSSFEHVLQNPFNLEAFINGEVDAIDGYSTDEPYELYKRGVPFNIFQPRSAGIDFYGDNLFTSNAELSQHPERVQRFRQASLDGWRYAMAHPEEIIQLILEQYPTELDRDALTFEAQQLQQLMHPELIEIGYMLEKRWRHIAETYAELGMLPEDISMKGFLYEEPHAPDLFWYLVSLITLGVLAVVTLIALRFRNLNRMLSRLLRIKNQFVNVGESVNHIAHQWKQPLNELAIQLMQIQRLVHSERSAEQACTEVVAITDRGHEVLQFMADTVDAFGRILNTRPGTEIFAPHDVLQDVLRLLQDSLAAQQITIDYVPDCDVRLRGNPTDFSQVVLSVLTNAREIIAERTVDSPRINITSIVSDSHYVLTISDNAGGISTRKIEDIFSLGYSDKHSPDTGVGLYIARELTTNGLGGTLAARNSGTGAVFTLTAPTLPEQSDEYCLHIPGQCR